MAQYAPVPSRFFGYDWIAEVRLGTPTTMQEIAKAYQQHLDDRLQRS